MNKTTTIWIILFLLTSITLFLGGLNNFSFTFVVITLIITFIKGQFVIDYFMGLKDVRLKYRLFVSFWLFFIIILISLSFAFPVQN